MARLLRQAWTIAAKDLRLELRSPAAFASSLAFTGLMLAIFNFARDPTVLPAIELAPTILWITFSFAGLLGLNRAFVLERENRALDGLMLSPLDRTALYLGKALGNLMFVGTVEAIALPLFVLFFNVSVLPVLWPLLLVIVLATIGYVAVGTLVSAIAIHTRFADLLLMVLMLPFLVAPVIAAVQVTSRLLVMRPLSESAGWLKLLLAYDIVTVVAALLLFEYTLDE